MSLRVRDCAPITLLLSLLICAFVYSARVSAQIAQRETLYVDDSEGEPYYAETGTTWATNQFIGWNGSHRYVTLDDPTNINQTARWTPDVAAAGYHIVSFYLPYSTNGRNHVLYLVSSFGSVSDSSWHDQNYNSGNFINLGIHFLPRGSGSFVEVVNDSTSTFGYTFRADATRFILGPDHQDIEPGRRNGYDYGEVALPDSKDWVLRIYNIGGATLEVDAIAFGSSGAYSLCEPSPPIDIVPQGYEDFTVRFRPFAEQNFDDTLRIISNDADEPSIPIPLKGKGVASFVVINDDDGPPGYVEEAGEWRDSAARADCPGISNIDSRYTIQGTNPGARATFTPNILRDGFYRIEMAVPPTASASDHALYVISPGGGAVCDSVWVDQNTTDFNPCEWKDLGIYYFIPGRGNSVSVINDGTGAGYVIRTDLMKFTYCSAVPVASETPMRELPQTYALLQNYPNPFNTSTEIRYRIPKENLVILRIYNIQGQEVRVLMDTDQSAGEHIIHWDGQDDGGREVTSGIYFCQLKTGDFSKIIKMVFIK
jgi:hypothetical protein